MSQKPNTKQKPRKRAPATRKPKPAPAAPPLDRRIPHMLAVALYQYLETRPAGETNGNGGPEVWRLMAALDATEPLPEAQS